MIMTDKDKVTGSQLICLLRSGTQNIFARKQKIKEELKHIYDSDND